MVSIICFVGKKSQLEIRCSNTLMNTVLVVCPNKQLALRCSLVISYSSCSVPNLTNLSRDDLLTYISTMNNTLAIVLFSKVLLSNFLFIVPKLPF